MDSLCTIFSQLLLQKVNYPQFCPEGEFLLNSESQKKTMVLLLKQGMMKTIFGKDENNKNNSSYIETKLY